MQEQTAITRYAEPTSAWEAWFEEYRYGALYIFPPSPLRARVNALRQRFDPRAQAICDAHISLTVPVPQPMQQAQGAEIARALSAVPPFEVTWGPPYQYPGIAGVVLQIEPTETPHELVRTLERCSCFDDAPPRRYPFSPHMTLAEFITVEQSVAILGELSAERLEGRFWCSEVVYAVPDASFHFSERVAWPLGEA